MDSLIKRLKEALPGQVDWIDVTLYVAVARVYSTRREACKLSARESKLITPQAVPRYPRRLIKNSSISDSARPGKFNTRVCDCQRIYVETRSVSGNPLNNRLADVTVSRGAYDAQLFTNDSEKLGVALGREVFHPERLRIRHAAEQSIATKIEHSYGRD